MFAAQRIPTAVLLHVALYVTLSRHAVRSRFASTAAALVWLFAYQQLDMLQLHRRTAATDVTSWWISKPTMSAADRQCTRMHHSVLATQMRHY